MTAIKRISVSALVIFTAVFQGFGQGVNVEVTNISVDNFPGIHVFVRVTNDLGVHIPDLGYGNFMIQENGTAVQPNVQTEEGYMAASLVMDKSGSMSGQEQNVINACNFFVNGMNELDKGAIIKFSSSASVDVPMTYNKTLLLNSIASYTVGGSTALWDGIYLGIQECFPEPEKKAVVAFTDGMNNAGSHSCLQLPAIAGDDITIYTIGIGANITSDDSLIWVAEQTGGFYIYVTSPSQMGQVLDDIREDIGNLYDVYYLSPDPTPNGTTRNILVTVNYQGDSGWDVASYTAPISNPPTIAVSPATISLTTRPHAPNVNTPVSCTITGQNPITTARVYYKRLNETYFSQGNMTHTGNLYQFTIPAATMTAPGVLFYFQATDNQGNTVTAPAYNPGYLPLGIPVSPNDRTTMPFWPPNIWLQNQTITLDAKAIDPQGIMQVSLFFKDTLSYFYMEKPMTHVSGDWYTTEIEGPYLKSSNDLEVFFVVWDGQGFPSYWMWGDDPWYIDVLNEMPSTPPAMVLQPQLPIVIPAAGGNFTYTAFFINPIPGGARCDAWADMIMPDGSLNTLGTLWDEQDLLGGEIISDQFIQEVPDTAEAGNYLFRVHTGEFDFLDDYYTASFNFTKAAGLDGGEPYRNGFRFYRADEIPFDMGSEPILLNIERPNLGGGFPNPFNAATKMDYYVPDAGPVEITIHNISGEEVACLASGVKAAGSYTAYWNASSMASGIYFCRMEACGEVLTSKLVLIK